MPRIRNELGHDLRLFLIEVDLPLDLQRQPRIMLKTIFEILEGLAACHPRSRKNMRPCEMLASIGLHAPKPRN